VLDMQPLINTITAAIDKSVNDKMKNTAIDKKTDRSNANKHAIGAQPPPQGNGRRTGGQGEGPRKTFVNGNGSQFHRNQSLSRDFGANNESPDAHNGFGRGRSFHPGRFGDNRPRSMSVGSVNRRPFRFQQNRGRMWTNGGNQNLHGNQNIAAAQNFRGAQNYGGTQNFGERRQRNQQRGRAAGCWICVEPGCHSRLHVGRYSPNSSVGRGASESNFNGRSRPPTPPPGQFRGASGNGIRSS